MQKNIIAHLCAIALIKYYEIPEEVNQFQDYQNENQRNPIISLIRGSDNFAHFTSICARKSV